MSQKKKSLERLVEHHDSDKYVKHFDLLDPISHHLVIIIFVSFLFIFAAFMFLIAEPTPNSTVAYAIFQYKPIHIQKDIAGSIGKLVYNIRHSEERPFVLLMLYTFWIVIFGLINMVMFERQRKK